VSWQLWFQRWPVLIKRGGPGSGHHGHAGRPGKHGGSAPGKKGVSAEWNVSERDYVAFFGDVSKEQVEEAFVIPGLEAELAVSTSDPGRMDLWVTWYREGVQVGKGERGLYLTPEGKKEVWEGQSLDFVPEFQNKGFVTSFYDKQVALAREIGYPRMEVYAVGTIGRYAWAKKGYEYVDKGKAQWATQVFKTWLIEHDIDLPKESWPVFTSVHDVATFKYKGLKFVPREHSGFSNRDVPLDMELDLGKAFMLDMGIMGHGPWEGEMLL